MTDSGCLIKSEQLYLSLRESILNESYASGSRLPDERELAGRFCVARNTLRQALGRLESEGYISRIRSHGTFVNGRVRGVRRIVAVETLPYRDISNPTHYLIPGLKQGCDAAGVSLDIVPLPIFREFVPDDSVIGFVTFGGRFSGKEDYIHRLREIGKPVVMLESYPGDVATTGFTALRTDIFSAWNDAAVTLKRIGFRRIAFLTHSVVRGYGEDHERWFDFLKREGIFLPDFVKFIGASADSVVDPALVERAVNELCGSSGLPDAILCFSDFFAIEVCRILKKRNIRIPDEIAVMGFCGFPSSAYLSPPLSTIDFRYSEAGREAVELLLRKDFPCGADLFVDYEILLRESTGQSSFLSKGARL